MSWSLYASGHVPPQDTPDDAVATEVGLYEALKAVLADPKYGTYTSSFSGSHVSGSLHLADA